MQWADETAADPLEVRVYAGADAQFSLFEDDGASQAYRTDAEAYSSIAFAWDDASGTLSVGARAGKGFPGMPATRTINVVFVGGSSVQGHGAGIGPCAHPDAVVQYTGTAVTVKRGA